MLLCGLKSASVIAERQLEGCTQQAQKAVISGARLSFHQLGVAFPTQECSVSHCYRQSASWGTLVTRSVSLVQVYVQLLCSWVFDVKCVACEREWCYEPDADCVMRLCDRR